MSGTVAIRVFLNVTRSFSFLFRFSRHGRFVFVFVLAASRFRFRFVFLNEFLPLIMSSDYGHLFSSSSSSPSSLSSSSLSDSASFVHGFPCALTSLRSGMRASVNVAGSMNKVLSLTSRDSRDWRQLMVSGRLPSLFALSPRRSNLCKPPIYCPGMDESRLPSNSRRRNEPSSPSSGGQYWNLLLARSKVVKEARLENEGGTPTSLLECALKVRKLAKLPTVSGKLAKQLRSTLSSLKQFPRPSLLPRLTGSSARPFCAKSIRFKCLNSPTHSGTSPRLLPRISRTSRSGAALPLPPPPPKRAAFAPTTSRYVKAVQPSRCGCARAAAQWGT
mmetsp:Transcript_45798/g.77826  ORF Transcript_45798/g.77826 Transcript_45798/m.77826 type:complete len:332 (+) Transcript_45798:108-1103(+)